ncbi:polysaccharide biosynthesis protein [Methylicorpusculum oleiharenae]|uniref:polysaccharide biosynthesis protein n=1 Tax=Methylicorpusculum oleiharenae TaxID=1338687 RepID=UPI001356825A|nr:nucleoside-diphosphate sugar epimerase/dehydratase [Methylicorpusculum oleiharenae]MCD2449771.1 polysaccharide biosynthesis protein [Methylicorpusculum oleiharenae]
MERLAYWFLMLSRPKKAVITMSADVFFSVFALWLAFSLRLGVFYVPTDHIWILFVLAPCTVIPIFIRMGLYRAIIRYIGVRALATITQAVTLYALIFAALVFQLRLGLVPRTVPPLNWLLMLFFASGSRFMARWWFGDLYARLTANTEKENTRRKNVIIYGAGSAGAQLAAALINGREYRPVAFIDDDSKLHKQKINGIRIYPLSALTYLIERHKAADLLLAIPSATRARRSEIISRLEPYPVHVRTMPGMADMAQGKVTFDELQEVDVADLLGRDAVTPDPLLLTANISGKVVMVTGAGGSIGSELCRQIFALKPSALILFEMSEFSLYELEKELLSSLTRLNAQLRIVPVLGSVLNQKRVEKICTVFGVQTIYHAAAYKHVPMVEKNPGEAVLNNVFGTLSLAKAAIQSKVETFVLISTDKAVRPTNTMGATKRFAELILQALSVDNVENHKIRFTMVRFGNVLGSSGSVVPLFREQIARGGPVTVTDSRIIRYFMTIPEASQLVIQAGALGRGGDVFVLDMGEPVRILDLARRMIHLSGLTEKNNTQPSGDIEIVFTGLRPGEKLYEELLIGENVSETSHPRIMRAQEEIVPWKMLNQKLQELEKATLADDYEQVRKIFKDVVSGFAPQCTIEDWIWTETTGKLSGVNQLKIRKLNQIN